MGAFSITIIFVILNRSIPSHFLNKRIELTKGSNTHNVFFTISNSNSSGPNIKLSNIISHFFFGDIPKTISGREKFNR